MFEEIKKVLREHYGITDLRPDTDFKKDLGLSSFDLMNLICIVEEQYGVELDEERYRSLSTIQDMSDYLETLGLSAK